MAQIYANVFVGFVHTPTVTSEIETIGLVMAIVENDNADRYVISRGDSDGVAVSPKNCEDDVLQAAETIESAEEVIRAELRKGTRLDRARKQPGYHKLQIPED